MCETKISLTDALQYVGCHDKLVKFDPWDNTEFESGGCFCFSQFHNVENEEPSADHFILPQYMQGGDYDGSLIQKANHNCFLEEFGEVDGVCSLTGGHGSFGIAIRLSTIMANEEIRDCLKSLEDYPLIDDEKVYDLEMESADEHWDYWVKQEYVDGIEKMTGLDEGVDWELTSDDLRCLFEERREKANVYWQNESGTNMHVDVDAVLAKTNIADVESKSIIFAPNKWLEVYREREANLVERVAELENNIVRVLLPEKRHLEDRLRRAEKTIADQTDKI